MVQIWKLIVYTLGASAGFLLSARFIAGVVFNGSWQNFVLAGFLFAVLYLIAAPILKFITFPLRALTFNLFSFVIDMALVWVVDGLMPPTRIHGLLALFETTLIILILNAILWQIFSPSSK